MSTPLQKRATRSFITCGSMPQVMKAYDLCFGDKCGNYDIPCLVSHADCCR